MAIVQCKCGYSKEINDKFIGRKTNCPKCKEPIVVSVKTDTVQIEHSSMAVSESISESTTTESLNKNIQCPFMNNISIQCPHCNQLFRLGESNKHLKNHTDLFTDTIIQIKDKSSALSNTGKIELKNTVKENLHKRRFKMASFELSKKIKADQELDASAIKDFIKERLSISCKYQVVSDSGSTLSIKGAVKESLFTPVTKFEASFEVKVEGDKARVSMHGNSGPNWIFWIFFLVGLFTGIFLLIGIGLFLVQRNRPKETCDGILNSIDTEFSSI